MENPTVITDRQLDLLIDVVRRNYSYDFSDFGKPTMQRRVSAVMTELKSASFDELLERIAHEEDIFLKILRGLSINVTSLFREPKMFLYLRQHIFPRLASYPNIRIWSAGTSTGEEAYSLAILLQETGLADRAQIYATDFNPVIIKTAAQGKIPLKKMAEYTRNYQLSGGMHSLSRYYSTSQDHAWFEKSLKDNIVFSTHNLTTDGVFNEFQLILCRNVLIYFNAEGQTKKLQLFRNSLTLNGYLCLGQSESLRYAPANLQPGSCFEAVNEELKIYQCRPANGNFKALERQNH
jgi:chemotaxis protein methyltransferase CheR